MAEIKARPGPFSVTENAARRIGAILGKESQPGLKLRISVSGGGCPASSTASRSTIATRTATSRSSGTAPA